MKKITNTEKEPRFEWLLGGNPNAIEQQEKQGQQELVSSLQLPRKVNSPRGVNAAEQYHKMGIQVFTSSKGDDLFLGVKLPEGWKKEATEHSMWSRLLDNNGIERGSIFYKAAFYDRDSFINFNTRYHVDYVKVGETYEYAAKDRLTGLELFRSENQDSNLCRTFLTENYPDWEDINSYWEATT